MNILDYLQLSTGVRSSLWDI